jgi:hypothetical protein
MTVVVDLGGDVGEGGNQMITGLAVIEIVGINVFVG